MHRLSKTFLFCLLLFGIQIAIPLTAADQTTDELLEIYTNEKLADSTKLPIIIKKIKVLSPTQQLLTTNALLRVAQKEKSTFWRYNLNYIKGNTYIHLGESERACSCYFTCLKLAEKNKKTYETHAILGLANAYSVNNNDSLAIQYYQISYAAFQKQQDTANMRYTLLNLTNNFNRLHLADSVQACIARLESLKLPTNNVVLQGYYWGYKSLAAAQQGKLDQSLTYFARASSYLKLYQRIYDLVAFQSEFAEVLEQQQAFDLALAYADSSYASAQKHQLKEEICDASKLLARLYARQKETKKAFQYLQIHKQYMDSINHAEVIRRLSNLETNYTLEKQQWDIDVLEKKRRLSHIGLWLISLASLLLLLMSSVLFHFNRYRKKLNRLLRENETQLKQQKESLEQSNAAKAKMFSMVSHDLRDPIHSVSTAVSFLKDKINNNEKKSLQLFTLLIQEQLRSISALLDNLLAWSSNQQGAIHAKPAHIDLYALMQEQWCVFHYALQSKEIVFKNMLPQPCFAYADTNTMATIFRNILNNAIKFTSPGGHIQVKGYREKEHTLISIEDTGVGMSPEKCKKLFTPGAKESSYGTQNEKGFGLGLRLVYEFVELNKGKIWVESEEGNGTTFYIQLPSAQ